MDNFLVLVLIGFLIGTFGTLIGAGGGFLLVPLLLLTHPQMPPETVTAISIALVAVNALSGSVAYARSGRIDFKAGLVFSLFTIPGSIIGVYLTNYIPVHVFHLVFGLLLLVLATYLFIQKKKTAITRPAGVPQRSSWKSRVLKDREGQVFAYTYNQPAGIVISLLVGFLSPLLGIGGGIIHVPAMVQWLRFPVYIATATSHFILAVMSVISVAVHALNGSYNDAAVLQMVAGLCTGVIPGAQLGAYLSHKIPTGIIIRALAVCLAIVGLRILLSEW